MRPKFGKIRFRDRRVRFASLRSRDARIPIANAAETQL
jgi:hypothetical protein